MAVTADALMRSASARFTAPNAVGSVIRPRTAQTWAETKVSGLLMTKSTGKGKGSWGKTPRREYMESAIGRFWSKVEKRGPDECWMWQGSIALPNPCGMRYGQFGVMKEDNTSYSYRAHRFAWILMNGPIPEDHVIMHLCDTPLCVNPAHLKAGTQADNLHDRDRKGRQLYGEKHNMVKLTEDQARAIRETPQRVPHSALAKRYGVHTTTITKIRDGRLWKHL